MNVKRCTERNLISLILGRTFPTHAHFIPRLGSGQLGLFNVLKAYSILDDEVGYCQGISFVAGIMLMHVSIYATRNILCSLCVIET